MNPSVAEGYSAPPASPERPFPPVVRSHGVSEVTPAKKITFFKSGDPQFSGVKMAINRRSFKSFSALMDDLSNKVPLPFGVRTITTPRGTHNISRLEQLQDGGRYICSDKKYVQPIAGRKVGNQRPSRPSSGRKQGQHEDVEEEFSTAHFQQVPKVRKKIVLVKNGEPTTRRSIILNRRNARNFRTFLEDASDLLQYTVRRLYTVDGRRIETIQAVLQSAANILICAGREPFKPIQIENMRKSVTEKLPGLRSHASNNTEVMDNKKNASFGLKAKKSVIHPRSASSNKTRLSLSSEKSYPNGLNMSPVNSGFGSYPDMCPHGKSEDAGHSLLNDDIEKKVHVNKDGSLSVEMKVRFRLLNEETLQWSTQIKKSSTMGKTKCEQLCLFDENDKKEEINPANYSETDESFYPCDADSYSSKNEAGIEDMYCSHCGMQCQEYDIWKNPMHVNQQEDYVKRATWQTRSSASSASSHHRLMCDQKTSIDSVHSVSSEEYTEHIMHRSSHYSESKENGDTMVTYSTVSQCASRSGRSTVASNVDAISDTEQTKRVKSRNKSCSSLKSQGSMRKQESQLSEEQNSHRSHGGSFEECPEASPTPCSDGEHCNQKISASHSSLRSRKSQCTLLKRNSTNTKSFSSSISYHEEQEEVHQSSCKGSLKNMQGISTETGNSEDPCGSEPAENTNNLHDDEMNDKHTENALSADPMIRSPADYDKRSTGASSRASMKSRSSSKKSVKVNGHDEDTLCNSPGLSSIAKENNESEVVKQESMDTCENDCESKVKPLSQSKRKSFTDHQSQSLQSTLSRQSMSSITESVKPNCEQDEQQILNHQENCNESCTEKSDHRACSGNEDGERSPPISRASSKSLSSKFNCASCQENEQVFNVSSRVSSLSEKKSIVKSCSDKSDHDSAREMSEEEPIHDNMEADPSSQTAAPDANCIHSPSPPEGKPFHKQLRLAQFKLSSTSLSSDQMKTVNGEKTGNSRASTPGSKRIVASRASTETCKKTTTVIANHNSTEDNQSTKKRKNSSSSSKRKHKGESLDADNNINSELVPSALPNVTPEEVVNEWLRKIPSQTMVVEYEVEECQKKTQTEIETEAKTDICKKQEEGDVHVEPVAEDHNSNETKDKMSQDGHCINTANDIQDAKISNGTENEDSVILSKVAANNVKNEICDKKGLPNNIQTSVQIMKALLSPLQESKFDRSNSLPEVSQTMGRKLSNSASVLISCLASLQLLDEGQTEITKNENDFKKPKYMELLNILQALWAEGPTNKSITNIKSGKRYSRDDELTPVSSSGVDLNSGYGGSGDGSVTGGGDHMAASGKAEDGKLSTVAKEVVANGQENANKAQSCVMDENMNEKKLDTSQNTFEAEIKEETKEEGHYNSVNNVNDVECIQAEEEHRIPNNDNMNILSHSDEPKSNESNSNNSPSECQSTIIISTSDSNGKNEDKQGLEADPVWVLMLLKKIEKEFMTHYVDAMNEFKVRWNLEDNENLDEMIAELKNEVSQRIQRSISNELKRIKSGTRVPRPPPAGSKRKSSIQAEERRRRLQTMHRVSIHRYASGENRGIGTNDLSCETDEEDLTFSASFGDDSSGQPNDDFCPCEKCIRQKRALKLAKPREVAANAPIIKAFDLQQILRLKRGNDDPPKIDESDGAVLSSLEEQSKEAEQRTTPDCSAENEEASNKVDILPKAEEGTEGESDISSEDSDIKGQEIKSAVDEGEGCDSSVFQSNTTLQEKETEQLESVMPDEESKHAEDLEEDLESTNSDTADKNSTIAKEVNVEGPGENTSICEETENNDDHETVDQQLPDNQEETHENEENKEELNERDEISENEDNLVENEESKEELNGKDEISENEDHLVENEATNPEEDDTEEDGQGEDIKTIETNGSHLLNSCLGQGSLITHNGSMEDAETECKENHNVGETSPNGQSNSSGSKKSQMYPDSPSEDEEEDGDSPRPSPVPASKNETIGQVYANNIESLEECDNKSKKVIDEDIIDQDDLDF